MSEQYEVRKVNYDFIKNTVRPLDILLATYKYRYTLEKFIPAHTVIDANGQDKFIDEQIVERKEKQFTLTDLFGRSTAIKINKAIYNIGYCSSIDAVEYLCSVFEIPITREHLKQLAFKLAGTHIGYAPGYPNGEIPIDLANTLVYLRFVRDGKFYFQSDFFQKRSKWSQRVK